MTNNVALAIYPVPSLTRGKCLDADDIAIFAMSDHHDFVMSLLLCHHFAMNDHYCQDP